MKTTYTKALVWSLMFFAAGVNAADRHWITGPGNNTMIDTNYGTATMPLSWFDSSKWFEDDDSTPASVPVDGESVLHDNSCCNPEPFVDVNNGGSGVNLPNSAVEFTAKTNLFDLSAGDLSDVNGGSYDFAMVDDFFVADSIALNGEGGASVDVYVPMTADTMTSNRHGARFYTAFTVNRIEAKSRHQDKWEINASPTAKIEYVELNEDNGADGGTIDGFFAVNADTQVTNLNHIWQRLQVGTGATLTVDTVDYSDHTNKASNNNVNPITLDGDMVATRYFVHDVESGMRTQLEKGTYGRTGNMMVDNQVDWITAGDGILTILQGPEACYVIKASGGNSISVCL